MKQLEKDLFSYRTQFLKKQRTFVLFGLFVEIMEPRIQKAFEFASDSTKQLITLSTGIVTLTIAFAKNILGGVPLGPSIVLMFAWAVYLFSILFGIVTLLALTGSLDPVIKSKQEAPATIRGKNVTRPSACQILSFLIATALTVVFGVWAALVSN
jgi:hypothetical protein